MKKSAGKYSEKIILFRLFVIAIILSVVFPENGGSVDDITIARLKYEGGGDWYSNPSSLPNLFSFIRAKTGIPVSPEPAVTNLSDGSIFAYPIVYMNGHGNVSFTQKDAETLRRYLLAGGFLIADDNYGMDKSFRREIKKVFPDKELVLLPLNHPVFSVSFNFPDGLPKIHEHDRLPAQAFAIFSEGENGGFLFLPERSGRWLGRSFGSSRSGGYKACRS